MKQIAELDKHREKRTKASICKNEQLLELAALAHSIEKLVIAMEKNLKEICQAFNFEMIKVTLVILQHLQRCFNEHCSKEAINNRKPEEVIVASADILCNVCHAVVISELGIYLFEDQREYLTAYAQSVHQANFDEILHTVACGSDPKKLCELVSALL